MSKRSDFPRIPRDLYRTWDGRAIPPLRPFLPRECRFVEPCAGEGDLIRLLEAEGHRCIGASDIEPLGRNIQRGDALQLQRVPALCDFIITNPPWKRALLHALIRRLMGLAPTWLLFDSDWAFCDQAAEFLPHCIRIVAVGRLRWIPGTEDDGKDNCSWYLFDRRWTGPTEFIGKRV